MKEEDIFQREYIFGPSNEPMRTICAVFIPLECKASNNNERASFNVRFDVIDGKLLFLLEPPSLLAVKRNLHFQYGNLPIIIRGIRYCLQLVKRSSHMQFPLVRNVTHQRPLRELGKQRSACNISTDESPKRRVHIS